MNTIGELKDKIKKFTCTEEQTFLTEAELCCFIDMAQKRAMDLISCLNKDYFKASVDIPIESKTSVIDLPEDIKGTRIKRVLWKDGKCCTTLERTSYICDTDKCSTYPCQYMFLNNKETGPQITLYPTPSKAATIQIIYERIPCDINESTPDDTGFEFPQICQFVFDFVTLRIYQKEKNPLLSVAASQMNESQRILEECMSNQFQDSCDIKVDECWADYVNECSGRGYGY